MKFVESSVEQIVQKENNILGIYKQIELAGRICYKSENKITEDSAKKFVETLNNNKHYAMFEHGTVYLRFSMETHTPEQIDNIIERYSKNPYSSVILVGSGAEITTNYRVIVENNWFDDLQYICDPCEHDRRYTFKFICSRSIANEIVRHRKFSFAQESTRFCNYTKSDKFEDGITFISANFPKDSEEDILYLMVCQTADRAYTNLINKGVKPQFARDVLPLGLKTELIVTGFKEDWENFFKLRCSVSAHPDIQKLAYIVKQQIN